MFRFFTTKFSFGAESTAVKIIYHMKDLHRDNQGPTPDAYGGQYDSDNIVNRCMLVSKLSKIILDTIEYARYKNLTLVEKNNIKMEIARQLYLASKNFESSHYDPDAWNITEAKGISFSTQFKNYPYDEAYEVNFPEKLFSDQPLINYCIRMALSEQYSFLLIKKENPSFNLAYDL